MANFLFAWLMVDIPVLQFCVVVHKWHTSPLWWEYFESLSEIWERCSGSWCLTGSSVQSSVLCYLFTISVCFNCRNTWMSFSNSWVIACKALCSSHLRSRHEFEYDIHVSVENTLYCRIQVLDQKLNIDIDYMFIKITFFNKAMI